MKKIGKIGLLTLFSFLLVLLASGYIYLTKSAYWKIPRNEREEMVAVIKAAPALPDRFYELYNKVYSQSLEKGQFYYFLKRNKGFSECPCRIAAYHVSLLSPLYGVGYVSVAFWLEDKVSQKECLNYYVSKQDFTSRIFGLSQASEFYFDKPMEQLTDRETVELILMMRNPSYFDKRRYSDRLDRYVDETMDRIGL